VRGAEICVQMCRKQSGGECAPSATLEHVSQRTRGGDTTARARVFCYQAKACSKYLQEQQQKARCFYAKQALGVKNRRPGDENTAPASRLKLGRQADDGSLTAIHRPRIYTRMHKIYRCSAAEPVELAKKRRLKTEKVDTRAMRGVP
jgi:hypothetical protein